jgi:hypothetical protein
VLSIDLETTSGHQFMIFDFVIELHQGVSYWFYFRVV